MELIKAAILSFTIMVAIALSIYSVNQLAILLSVFLTKTLWNNPNNRDNKDG